jgi:hypothetical protein
MFGDKLTILDENDLIAIFGSIEEMKYQIDCILIRQSFDALAKPDATPDNYTPIKLDEIF